MTQDSSNFSTPLIGASPASKANELLQLGNKEKIRKRLTFGYSLSDEVRQKLHEHGKKTPRVTSHA